MLYRAAIPAARHALLQDGQELEPADRGEADAVDLDALSPQIERDVLPALHPRRDGIDGFGIVGAQEFQRLFGEHHAKPPGRAFGVLFEQVDMRVRMTPFPEIGEVETAGASADDGDTHVFLPIDSILTNLRQRLIRTGNFRYRKIERNTVSGGRNQPFASRGRRGEHEPAAMDRIFQPVGHRDQRRDILRVFASMALAISASSAASTSLSMSASSASVVTSLFAAARRTRSS